MGKPNLDNLIKYNELTAEEKRELHSEGGKASARKRREKRTFAEILRMLSELPCVDSEIVDKAKEMGVEGDLSNKVAWVLSFINNFKNGDVKSLQLAVDLLQEDRKKEEEIKKLKIEQEALLQEVQLSSVLKDKLVINMDVSPTGETGDVAVDDVSNKSDTDTE